MIRNGSRCEFVGHQDPLKVLVGLKALSPGKCSAFYALLSFPNEPCHPGEVSPLVEVSPAARWRLLLNLSARHSSVLCAVSWSNDWHLPTIPSSTMPNCDNSSRGTPSLGPWFRRRGLGISSFQPHRIAILHAKLLSVSKQSKLSSIDYLQIVGVSSAHDQILVLKIKVSPGQPTLAANAVKEIPKLLSLCNERMEDKSQVGLYHGSYFPLWLGLLNCRYNSLYIWLRNTSEQFFFFADICDLLQGFRAIVESEGEVNFTVGCCDVEALRVSIRGHSDFGHDLLVSHRRFV